MRRGVGGGTFAQFSWVLAGRIVAAGCQALALALVARNVTPSSFGLLASVLGVLNFVATGFDLGLSTFILRERALDRHSGAVTRALGLSRWTAVIVLVVGITAVLLLAQIRDPRYWAMVPLIAWLVAERQTEISMSVCFADGQVNLTTTNLVLRRGLTLASTWAGLAAGLSPIWSFTLGSAAAATVGWSASLRVVGGRVVPPDGTPYLHILSRSRYYWLNSAATQARNLDAALVTALGGAAVSGAYSVASRLTSPLRMIPTSMAAVLLPAAARASREPGARRGVLRAVVLTGLVSTVLAALLALAVPVAIRLGLGEAYEDAVAPTLLVVASLPFAGVASTCSAVLQGSGHAAFVGRVALLTTVGCLLLVGVGSVLGGATAAAGGLAAAFALQGAILAARVTRLDAQEA